MAGGKFFPVAGGAGNFCRKKLLPDLRRNRNKLERKRFPSGTRGAPETGEAVNMAVNNSPSESSESSKYAVPAPAPFRFPWVSAVLGLGLVIVLGLAVLQRSNLVNLQLELKEVRKDVASLRESAAQTNSHLLQTVDVLRGELDSTKKENQQTVQATRAALKRQAESIAARLVERQEQQRQEQKKEIAEQAERLAALKSANDQASAKLTDITSEVGVVKSNVASTRSDLDKTIAELRRTTGDLGIMSGLIATNSKELAALKELGQRDYYEFTLTKQQKQQRVGDILVQVRKTDPKRNKFTITIVADDKHVEKKDKTVNEPVQFYVLSKARQPYELVVNEVKKDTIVGYLSMPKVKLTAQR
jgi:hypothetical protein